MADELDDVMLSNAAEPASVSGDAGSVSQQSLTNLIALDEHLAAKRAMAKKNQGLRFTRLIPGGTN